MSTVVTQELAKLRSDLVISGQGRRVVLKDPATGRFFRFGEAEDFITSQLDGTTPIAVVRRRAGRSRVGCLSRGWLKGSSSRSSGSAARGRDATLDRPVARRRRTVGGPLYLRFSAFDPTASWTGLVDKVAFCFTRPSSCSPPRSLCSGSVRCGGMG